MKKVNENKAMVKSQTKEIKHHADELDKVLGKHKNVESWVLGKIERASTDLSDVTHYLDGKEKYAKGGNILNLKKPLTHEQFVKLAKDKGYKSKEEASKYLGYRWDSENWIDDRIKPFSKRPKYAKGGGVGDDFEFNYMMLDRLQSDNDYYLKHPNEKNLWAGNVDKQISEMKKLWNQLPKDKKPEWLSMEDILEYEKKMKNNYAKGGTLKQREKVAKVMHEFKQDELHSGKSDKIVKDPKQAVAIALSQAGLSKNKMENGGEIKHSCEYTIGGL